MMGSDLNKLPRIFSCTAGALMLASALVMFISCVSDDRSIHPHDPVFMVSLPTFFKILGGIELAAALFCLFGKNAALQTGMVLWLALNLLFYRLGMKYCGVTGGLNGYTGSISDAFGVSRNLVNGFLDITVFYSLLGGIVSLSWSWWQEHQQRLHPVAKMSCPACGTHIKFHIQDQGRKIPCPHCQCAITLRKPDNLKMSCFFCQGHIEFPAHAIGEKMACPHCKMDITLKEPAIS